MLDADQIMDDLIPISRQDGGIRIGNIRCLLLTFPSATDSYCVGTYFLRDQKEIILHVLFA